MVGRQLLHRELEVEDMQKGGAPSQRRRAIWGQIVHQLLMT